LRAEPAPRDRDHPQSFGRQLSHRALDIGADVFARRQDHFGCAFDGQLVVGHRRRERPARPERQMSVGFIVRVEAVGRVHRQGRLDDGPVGGVYLRAAVCRRRCVRREAQNVLARITGHGMHLRHPQPVFGQRPGLVEANDVDAAQRLDRTGDPDQRAVLGQAPGRRGLRERRHQRHAFRDRGDGDRDSTGHRFAQPSTAQQAQ
jgi:hypothetical protein